jgi:hypothetical protein
VPVFPHGGDKIAAIFNFMTIRGLLNKYKQLDTEALTQTSIEESADEILKYQLQQLLDGKTNTGEDISPTYFNDPFFKTPEAARAYSEWKDKISPPSNRKRGVPNLYINGYYHSTIKVEIQGDKINIRSSFSEAPEIEAHYKNLYGLSPASKALYIAKVLRPKFLQKLRQAMKA